MIHGKGLVHERLPLLTKPGEALAAYLRQDRPGTRSRRVLVRKKAPHSGFAGPSTVSTIVRRAPEPAVARRTARLSTGLVASDYPGGIPAC